MEGTWALQLDVWLTATAGAAVMASAHATRGPGMHAAPEMGTEKRIVTFLLNLYNLEKNLQVRFWKSVGVDSSTVMYLRAQVCGDPGPRSGLCMRGWGELLLTWELGQDPIAPRSGVLLVT